MISIIAILFFVLLVAFPGFYIITRKIFPHRSKKSTVYLSLIVTGILIVCLLAMMQGFTW